MASTINKCLKCGNALKKVKFSETMQLKRGYSEVERLLIPKEKLAEIKESLEEDGAYIMNCEECNRAYYIESDGSYEENYRSVGRIIQMMGIRGIEDGIYSV